MKLRRMLVAGLIASSCLFVAPQTAEAKPDWIIKDTSIHESRDNKLDIVGHAWFFGATTIGAGVWYSIPVVPDGFLPMLNDSFAVEFGGFLTYWHDSITYGFGDCSYTYYRISPLAGVRWDFMLTPEWTVFGLAKMGFNYGFGSNFDCGAGNTAARPDISGITADGGVGAYWNFSQDMALRLEGGPFGLNVGISINM